MENKENKKEGLLLLIVVGDIIVSPLVLFLGYVLWTSDIGFNQTTLVIACAAIMVVAVFWDWLKEGVVLPGSQVPIGVVQSQNTNIKTSERVFIRPGPNRWQCAFCRTVWVLLALVSVPMTIGVLGEPGHGYRTGLMGDLYRRIKESSEWTEPVVLVSFAVLISLAVYVCLHYRAVTSGKEKVIVRYDRLARTASSTFLYFLTDMMRDVSLRKWNISRASIRSIQLRMSKGVSPPTLQIEHDEGRVWLHPGDWVPSDVPAPRINFSRGLRHFVGFQDSFEQVSQYPLIQELLARGYQVQFVQ